MYIKEFFYFFRILPVRILLLTTKKRGRSILSIGFGRLRPDRNKVIWYQASWINSIYKCTYFEWNIKFWKKFQTVSVYKPHHLTLSQCGVILVNTFQGKCLVKTEAVYARIMLHTLQ